MKLGGGGGWSVKAIAKIEMSSDDDDASSSSFLALVFVDLSAVGGCCVCAAPVVEVFNIDVVIVVIAVEVEAAVIDDVGAAVVGFLAVVGGAAIDDVDLET